jgi:hypothetical protein
MAYRHAALILLGNDTEWPEAADAESWFEKMLGFIRRKPWRR